MQKILVTTGKCLQLPEIQLTFLSTGLVTYYLRGFSFIDVWGKLGLLHQVEPVYGFIDAWGTFINVLSIQDPYDSECGRWFYLHSLSMHWHKFCNADVNIFLDDNSEELVNFVKIVMPRMQPDLSDEDV